MCFHATLRKKTYSRLREQVRSTNMEKVRDKKEVEKQ
jgi:hypothetical protein